MSGYMQLSMCFCGILPHFPQSVPNTLFDIFLFVSFLSQVEFHIWTTEQKNDMHDYFLDPPKDGT